MRGDLLVEVAALGGRQGFDALPYLLQAQQGGVDVYWAPSPGNFARLAKAGSWQPLGVNLKGLPAQIGGLALRDPQHLYQATELAGYGFAINATVDGSATSRFELRLVLVIKFEAMAMTLFNSLCISIGLRRFASGN